MTHDPLPPLTPEEGGLHGEIPDTPVTRAWFQELGERTHAMAHDPLCPVMTEALGSASTDLSVPTVDYRPAVPCRCEEYAKVRADERQAEANRRAERFGVWHDYRPELP